MAMVWVDETLPPQPFESATNDPPMLKRWDQLLAVEESKHSSTKSQHVSVQLGFSKSTHVR